MYIYAQTICNAAQPADHCTQPADHCTQPADHLTQPADHLTQPADHCTQPADHCTQPADHLTQPADHLTQPADHLTQPADHLTQPADHLTQPADHRTQPADHCTQPADHLTQPADHCTQPADHRTQPAGHCVCGIDETHSFPWYWGICYAWGNLPVSTPWQAMGSNACTIIALLSAVHFLQGQFYPSPGDLACMATYIKLIINGNALYDVNMGDAARNCDASEAIQACGMANFVEISRFVYIVDIKQVDSLVSQLFCHGGACICVIPSADYSVLVLAHANISIALMFFSMSCDSFAEYLKVFAKSEHCPTGLLGANISLALK